VPLLSRALKLPEADARVGAARFLEYTKSETALDSLLSALDDPDRSVQFAVMQSLGNLTEQHYWRPHTDTAESGPFGPLASYIGENLEHSGMGICPGPDTGASSTGRCNTT